ncbi:MAG: hypothetical protein FJY97_07290 [candidate division Zixibacteria bacterium]|nr:hypothetical protein [candidate division Zixibacteria bacterium]
MFDFSFLFFSPGHGRLAVFFFFALLVGCGSKNPVSSGFDKGPARFVVEGDRVVMTGVIDDGTLEVFKETLSRHPGIDTLVLRNVGGSLNSSVTFATGRLLRSR